MVGKMAAASESRVWPRPCPRGPCWAPQMCVRADGHRGVWLKSAVTKLVSFELFSK